MKSNNKIVLYVFVGLLCIYGSLFSEVFEQKIDKKIGLTSKVWITNLSELNFSLNEIGIPSFSESFFSFGPSISFLFDSNKYFVELNFEYGVPFNKPRNEESAFSIEQNLYFTSVDISIGYNIGYFIEYLIDKRSIFSNLFLFGKIGLSSYNLVIGPRSDQIILNPRFSPSPPYYGLDINLMRFDFPLITNINIIYLSSSNITLNFELAYNRTFYNGMFIFTSTGIWDEKGYENGSRSYLLTAPNIIAKIGIGLRFELLKFKEAFLKQILRV